MLIVEDNTPQQTTTPHHQQKLAASLIIVMASLLWSHCLHRARPFVNCGKKLTNKADAPDSTCL